MDPPSLPAEATARQARMEWPRKNAENTKEKQFFELFVKRGVLTEGSEGNEGLIPRTGTGGGIRRLKAEKEMSESVNQRISE